MGSIVYQTSHAAGPLIASAGVYFGQLLGMADHLSFTLGRAGYRIHKIVPYGPLHECLQYLIRRAQVGRSCPLQCDTVVYCASGVST